MIRIISVHNVSENHKKSAEIRKYFIRKTHIKYKNPHHQNISTMAQGLKKNKFLHLDLKYLLFITDFHSLLTDITNKKPK